MHIYELFDDLPIKIRSYEDSQILYMIVRYFPQLEHLYTLPTLSSASNENGKKKK